jgi:hypothetical protein
MGRRGHVTKLEDDFICYANAPKNYTYIRVSTNVLFVGSK